MPLLIWFVKSLCAPECNGTTGTSMPVTLWYMSTDWYANFSRFWTRQHDWFSCLKISEYLSLHWLRVRSEFNMNLLFWRLTFYVKSPRYLGSVTCLVDEHSALHSNTASQILYVRAFVRSQLVKYGTHFSITSSLRNRCQLFKKDWNFSCSGNHSLALSVHIFDTYSGPCSGSATWATINIHLLTDVFHWSLIMAKLLTVRRHEFSCSLWLIKFVGFTTERSSPLV